MFSISAVKKVKMGRWGSKEGDGGVFMGRMCKVPGHNGGQSNVVDSIESDPNDRGVV